MLMSQASVGEYKIGEEPKKILGYVPLQLTNEKWVLVISTLLPQVTANLRENFRLFFLLGVVILAAIIAFGLSLYYVNAKRIRAEEAHRQFEQMQQLQQQLNHASKLASIGEIVDTVAHEINTPTGIIAAQTDAIRLQMDSGDKFPEEIQVIKEQTRRISKYTRSLLGYSKRVPYNPEPIKLNDILDESIYLLGHRFRAKKVTVIKNFPSDLPSLLIDRRQIEQVFINLLNNAVDAFNGSGEIRVDVRMINKKLTIEKKNSLEGIEIIFVDNGKGIPATDIPQIFDPFFSTKPPSEGTGLGLYISKAIIQRHRGRIEVKSTVGKGTTFRIFLPNNLKEN
jgi:two-component system NtrC family sensor kinase